jgi:Ni,Fe-hydrogenase I small subunit
MDWLTNLFRKLPIWAHGLECEICQMTFISAEAHYNHVMKSQVSSRFPDKHLNKIPVLRK